MSKTKTKIMVFISLILFLSLLTPNTAFAHVDIASTTPVDGSVSPTQPKEAILTFEGLVDPSQVSMTLRKADGSKLESPKPITPPGPATNVKFSIITLTDGTYVLGYRAYSSDGHIVEGEFSFTVGNVVSPVGGKKFKQPQGGRTFEVFARTIFDIGFILLVGSFFWLLILFPKKEDPKYPNKLLKSRNSMEENEINQFFNKFIFAGAFILATGVLMRIISYLVVVVPGSSSAFRWSLFTNKTIITLTIGLILARGVKQVFTNAKISKYRNFIFPAYLFITTYAVGLISHAADQPMPKVDAVLWVFHVSLVALWVGPVVLYFFAYTLGSKLNKEELQEGLKQFAPLAFFAVFCSLATGAAQAYVYSGGALPAGEYGAILISKIAVVVSAIFIGGIHNRLVARGRVIPANLLAVEAILMLTIIMVASILATTAPLSS